MQSTATQSASSRPVDAEVIDRLFMAFHGYFGSLFAEKFKLGEQRDGKDIGVENAKRVWQAELSAFTTAEIMGALHQIRDSGAKYPPGLPEFVAHCRACRRPVTYEPPKALPPSAPGGVLRRLAQQQPQRPNLSSGGLATLVQCIASAVAHAGGDEVATLQDLERALIPGRPDARRLLPRDE